MKLKKYLFMGALVAATSSFAGNNYFYVGGGATLINSNSLIRINANDHANTGSITVSDTSSAGGSRAFLGYERSNNCFFVAGEIIGAPRDISGKKGFLSIFDPGTGGYAQDSFEIKYSRDFTVGGKIKVGGQITDNLSAFLGIGVINSRFKITYVNNTQKNIFNRDVYGMEPGAGISYKLSSNIRFGIEYFYQQYRAFKTKNLNTENGVSLVAYPKFKFNSFLFSLSLGF